MIAELLFYQYSSFTLYYCFASQYKFYCVLLFCQLVQVLLCTIVLPVFLFLFRLNPLGFSNSRTNRARNEPFSLNIWSNHLIAAFRGRFRSNIIAANPQTEILLFKQQEFDIDLIPVIMKYNSFTVNERPNERGFIIIKSMEFDQKKLLLANNHHFRLHTALRKLCTFN